MKRIVTIIFLSSIFLPSLTAMEPYLISADIVIDKAKDARLIMCKFNRIITKKIRIYQLDFHEVVSLIAPRPFLIIASQKDPGWKIKGVNEAYSRVKEVYALLGATEKLQKYSPDCGHEFPLESREKAYNWFDKWFQSMGGN